MKSTIVFLKFTLVSVALCSTRDFETSAFVAVSPIDGNDIYDTFGNVDWSCTSNATCTTPQSFCNEQKKCQCSPNYIFNAAMTACLEVATAYGDKCVETAQCAAYLLVGGTCTDGICNCAKGYHYLHGRCNKSSGLGEKCQNDDDCYVNADFEALSCTNNVCDCSDGFYQREYRTCRRKAEAIGAECAIDLDCTFDENARCNKITGCYTESARTSNNIEDELRNDVSLNIREVRAVDSNFLSELRCVEDAECSHLGSATCTETGYCICQRGYYFDSEMKNCIPELGENCQMDSNVTIKYSICRNGRWSCQASKVCSRNNRICRKATTKFNTSCQYDEQCYVFGPDSLCVGKLCICNDNSHYVKEQMFCWINKGLGDSCQRNEDCHANGFHSKLTCNNESKCACPVGTHVNSAETACINDTASLGDPCSADVDCKPLNNVQCLDESCACLDNYFDLSGTCVAGINATCSDNVDCKTENSMCASETCRCVEDLVSPSPDLCVTASPFDGECQYDVQCSTTVTDALCFKPEVAEPNESTIIRSTSSSGTCNCDTGHHRRYNKCYKTKVLDETCYSWGECYVTSDLDSVNCLKGVCTCAFNATPINSTFCQKNASSNYAISSLLALTIIFVIHLV